MKIISLPQKIFLFFVSLVCILLVSLFLYLFFFDKKVIPYQNFENIGSTATLTPIPTPDIKSLVLTGDVMLGRNVMNQSIKYKDFNYPFINVSSFLKTGDFVFVNFENPIVTGCQKIDSGFTFCSLPESIDGLLYAGIDIVNLANNHTQNFGKEGFLETEELLNKKGILTTGNGKLTVKVLGNLRFGFLGFDFTVQEPTSSDYQFIKSSNSEVDILVVAVHWGVEYEDTPRNFQREWAKKIVQNGADLIIGNHPHWVQGAECFSSFQSIGYTKAQDLENFNCFDGDVPVYYSLGNFVFDQMWSEETKKGVIVKLYFSDGKISDQKVLRTYIGEVGKPKLVDSE